MILRSVTLSDLIKWYIPLLFRELSCARGISDSIRCINSRFREYKFAQFLTVYQNNLDSFHSFTPKSTPCSELITFCLIPPFSRYTSFCRCHRANILTKRYDSRRTEQVMQNKDRVKRKTLFRNGICRRQIKSYQLYREKLRARSHQIGGLLVEKKIYFFLVFELWLLKYLQLFYNEQNATNERIKTERKKKENVNSFLHVMTMAGKTKIALNKKRCSIQLNVSKDTNTLSFKRFLRCFSVILDEVGNSMRTWIVPNCFKVRLCWKLNRITRWQLELMWI